MLWKIANGLVVACLMSGCGGGGDDGVFEGDGGRELESGRERGVRVTAGESLRGELERARRMAPGAARDKVLGELAWNSLELAPEVAEDAIELLPVDGAERIELTGHLAMRIADEELERALEWAIDLPSEKEMAAAFGRIALVMADSDPVEAARLLSETGVAGREFDVVVVQALERWAEQSPGDAAEWVALFPPGSARDAGLAAVVSEWVERDAAAAFRWVGRIEDEAIRESARGEVARAFAGMTGQGRERALSRRGSGCGGRNSAAVSSRRVRGEGWCADWRITGRRGGGVRGRRS